VWRPVCASVWRSVWEEAKRRRRSARSGIGPASSMRRPRPRWSLVPPALCLDEVGEDRGDDPALAWPASSRATASRRRESAPSSFFEQAIRPRPRSARACELGFFVSWATVSARVNRSVAPPRSPSARRASLAWMSVRGSVGRRPSALRPERPPRRRTPCPPRRCRSAPGHARACPSRTAPSREPARRRGALPRRARAVTRRRDRRNVTSAP
jgi:hypothetical protein